MRSKFSSQRVKTHHARTIFGSLDVKKVHSVETRSTFPSQSVEKDLGAFLGVRMSFARQAQGILHLVKSEQNVGFCGVSKSDDMRGTFEEDLERFIAGAVQETCSSEILGSKDDDFLKKGAYWSIRSLGQHFG